MKIAVFGAGAVGGYFGGRLALTGNDVTFVARGRHLEAMLSDGLQVQSINGDFTVKPVKATSRPEEIGRVDLVLCCVKSWQVSEVADAIGKLVGPQTVVVPLQNGVEAHTTLSRHLGAGHILPGLCRLISMIEAPGRIRHAGAEPFLAFGEVDGRLSRRVKDLGRLLGGVRGMTVDVSGHILAELWKKFMLIAPWSGVGALTRSPIGVCRSLPESREMLRQSILEVHRVALAEDVDVEAAAVEATIDFIDRLPPEATASLQRDVMNGRPSELHEQCGAVVRFAEKSGVSTPVNRFIYHSLLPLERKARGEISF